MSKEIRLSRKQLRSILKDINGDSKESLDYQRYLERFRDPQILGHDGKPLSYEEWKFENNFVEGLMAAGRRLRNRTNRS